MANQIIAPVEAPRGPEKPYVPPIGLEEHPFKYNKDYHSMSDFLGLSGDERMEEELAQKISFIRDYLGEKDELDATIKLRDMIRNLGIQERGPTLIKTLYRYARLDQQRQRIEKEQSLIVDKIDHEQQSQGEHTTGDIE